jgi:hypothetical protein
MTTDHGSSWNPNVVGPLDRCSRCWTPIGHDLAYCATCGLVSLSFHSLPVEEGRPCGFHNGRAAEWTCCLCQTPICKSCCDHETNPMSAVAPHWHCRHCVTGAKSAETGFFETLAEKRCCSRHMLLPMAFTCKSCDLPLCLSCSYFTAKGVFKKKPHEGPYCLRCFRMATLGGKRDVWFSGHDIAPGFL